MKNNSFEEIWDKLMSANKILISLHSGPDGDSFGSCTAMKYVLERAGKKVKLVSADTLSEALQNMPLTKEVQFGKDILDFDFSEFDILLNVDIATPEMIGKFKKNYQAPKNIFVINIDHHPTNPFYGNLNYVDSSQPSACSILIEFFKHCKVDFDSELSSRLLLGLCTDAGFFTFADSAEKALQQASFLISHGGKYVDRVLTPIILSQPLNLLKYYSLLVMKLRTNNEKKFAYALTTAEEIKRLHLNKADVRLGPNHLSYIKEFDFIFTLAELDNEIKGSFRSKSGVDVSLFAKELGGGGHKAAASFVLSGISLENAEKKVLETINKVGIHKYR